MGGYVYILTNPSKRSLYVGVTNNLLRRLHEHMYEAPATSYVARYNVRVLIYCEFHPTIEVAIAREKQLKAGSRTRKVALVDRHNPDWTDLATYHGRGELPEAVFPDFDYEHDREL